MEFNEKILALSNKAKQIGSGLATEEATKNALIMPFLINILGYDVFDPNEVIPEFTADIGTKKGEKVDYAIVKNSEVQILVECKKSTDSLSTNHASQLYRYFSVTKARIAILTNGIKYHFFTDLDAPNKMDEKPFLELDLENVDEHALPEILKLTKQSFDVESIISAAGELKYLQQIKRIFANQFKEPEDDFVRFFASRIYDGMLTQKVREQFQKIVSKALDQHLNDKINDRLKSAITTTTDPKQNDPQEGLESTSDEEKIITTEEEIEGFYIIRSILRQSIDIKRINHRDTQSYFGVLIDDNNRKPICRLHFNRSQKYIGLFDSSKKETRHPINDIDDIYKFSDQLKSTAAFYLNQ